MSEQAPEELSVKIRICDTMGFGVHYPGDVLVGMILGAMLGFLFYKIQKWAVWKMG